MKKILLLGAGKSAAQLITYLLQEAPQRGWELVVADAQAQALEEQKNKYKGLSTRLLDVSDEQQLHKMLADSELVISLLPASMHPQVAVHALETNTHMLTASYATEEIQQFSADFQKKGLILFMEMGLDPGIDHLIAMKLLDHIRSKGHTIHSFASYAGALLADRENKETNGEANPWNYKFAWSPSQIVRAGNEGAQFLQEGELKLLPYHQLFKRIERVEVPSHGMLECYFNRNAIPYKKIYQLDTVHTLLRGTLRPVGFCAAWHALVRLGVTDPCLSLFGLEKMTHRDFTNSFLHYHPTDSVELKLAHHLRLDREDDVMNRLDWLGLLDKTPIHMGCDEAMVVDILQHIMEKRWKMKPEDKDKVLLWEKVGFSDARTGALRHKQAYLSCIGSTSTHTAIAKTVGLALGIGAKLILTGALKKTKGLRLPVEKDIYEPALEELARLGIQYTEAEL